jgi:hypothetical protein
MMKANKIKDLRHRRKMFDILSSWYGSDFAAVEVSNYTPKTTHISNSIDSLLKKVKPANVQKLDELKNNWGQVVGEVISPLTTPESWNNGILTLSVRHSALIAELTPSLELVKKKIQEVYGENTCIEIQLVAANRRKRTPKNNTSNQDSLPSGGIKG